MNKILYFIVLVIVAGSFIINIFVDNEFISTIINIIALIVLVAVAIYLWFTLGRKSKK
ncbi:MULTISPECIES: hypothetical protein [Virgibacillus]|uniref:hypothetical protein n=1 Tax=Virgibacillus TaxID=84406 RepID=UPI0009567BCD|nr:MULTISPECIES: hypothetical protein [Virgibacillus]MBS7426820.1 hypothetical protein [Virgibacillus sp. 19R1-5]MED3739355.1 hypothetical protein [Virgibacillus pantothenticus]QTY17530.1 hypothetical protein KBP50_06670 [Virgibacillus pantothenticus]SIT15558.1 hypothetical protein SAMN05421787_1248 [Virgibacillus pantothenticus]